MVEKTININGCDCYYIRKPGRSDTKHLVVVFSGFTGDGKPAYNYQNSLSHCPADVLWIKDFFRGGESYYVCANGVMDVESIVYSLIMKTLSELNLSKNDCTILGGSKGGSAALYYGMKYDFKNIIATVPQFYIGTYVEQDWLYAFKHIVGSGDNTKEIQNELDELIIAQIKKANVEKNIYVITSLNDPQYKTEIEKNLILLKRFNNFNCIYANSDLIERHNQVNRHIIPVTLSILNLTVMGIAPKFLSSEVKYRSSISEGVDYLEPISCLNDFYIKDGRYFLSGDAYISGIPCPEYDDLSVELMLRNDSEEFLLALAKGGRNVDEYSESRYPSISYKRGVFCTPNYDGFYIDDLPLGVWRVFMKINARGIIRVKELCAKSDIYVHGEGVSKILSLEFKNNKVLFCVKAK